MLYLNIKKKYMYMQNEFRELKKKVLIIKTKYLKQ